MSDSVQSRSEGILRDIIDNTSVYPHKKGKSRIEDLLIELLEEGGSSSSYATALSLTINSSTFVMTGQLLNKDGDPLGTAQTIDLPLESVVVNGSYDAQTKKVILTLQNGNTIEFSVADLVSGLQTEITSQNKLSADLVDDSNTINKFVTASDKTAWNAKQEAIDSSHKLSADLVDDTNTTNKFVTAADKTAWNGKQDALTFDNTPTSESTNPVTSGGVYTSLAGKQSTIDSSHKLDADLVDDTSATNKFVTAADKTKLEKAVTTDDIGLGTDYFVYNGIRIYISATEPTGTIPDGSIGFGW